MVAYFEHTGSPIQAVGVHGLFHYYQYGLIPPRVVLAFSELSTFLRRKLPYSGGLVVLEARILVLGLFRAV